VYMASYAPLFAHADGWQWTPDLIWVDNLNSVGSANYQIQKLYSVNKGTHTVAALLDNKAVAGQDSLYVSAVVDKNSSELIIKVANTSNSQKELVFVVDGAKKINTQASPTGQQC
jgi:alpha-N-arabinofuranosidase